MNKHDNYVMKVVIFDISYRAEIGSWTIYKIINTYDFVSI